MSYEDREHTLTKWEPLNADDADAKRERALAPLWTDDFSNVIQIMNWGQK